MTRAVVHEDGSFAGLAAFAGPGRIALGDLPANAAVTGVTVNGVDAGPFLTSGSGVGTLR